MPTGTKAKIGDLSIENPAGYWRIKTESGWRRLHRVIMEAHLGRKLRSDEQVDHINGNKKDNRIENLQVLRNSDHQKKTYHVQKLGIKKYNDRKSLERKEWSEKNIKHCRSCGKEMRFDDQKYYFYKRATFLSLKKCSYGCKKKD